MARPGNLTWHAAALPSLSPARGFTLIELMVTLAILALLLMVAAPMATDWVSGTRTHQGRATLVQAYSQAKALALRNPCAIGSGGTVVTFKASVQDGRIALQSLLEGDSSCDFLEDFAQPDKTMPQQMLLPAGVSLQLGGQPVTSMEMTRPTIRLMSVAPRWRGKAAGGRAARRFIGSAPGCPGQAGRAPSCFRHRGWTASCA